jgi:NADPH:quinone reductase-like Zn-dependent oxidoreductase
LKHEKFHEMSDECWFSCCWSVCLIVAALLAIALTWFMRQPKDLRTALCSDKSKDYFRNKVMWITGASSGIGAELATQIARLGVNARIVISARRVDRLNELARTLSAPMVVRGARGGDGCGGCECDCACLCRGEGGIW